MNYIREKISGKKNRLKQNNFNLDLTYITPRIIAMAYPASGFESLYRNPINEVAQFLRENHDINYMVINLSGRKYDYSKFNKMVLEFQWEDHHAPQLSTLFQICDLVHKFLLKSAKNVIVIHCLAGKGRTGTAICCYFLYCQRFQNANEALSYYASKRFMVKGLGVTQPCQIRYVKYFQQLMANPHIFPVIKSIKQIIMAPIPDYNSKNSCNPEFQIWQGQQNDNAKLIYQNRMAKNNLDEMIFQKQEQIITFGDIFITFKHSGTLKYKNMFRLSFNVAFIENNEINLNLFDLGPDSLIFDQRFKDNFRVNIKFSDICECTTQTNFEQKCFICSPILQKEQIQWELIKELLSQYEKPTLHKASELLFGTYDLDDVDEFLKELKIRKNSMKDKYSQQNEEQNLVHIMLDDDQFLKLKKQRQSTPVLIQPRKQTRSNSEFIIIK